MGVGKERGDEVTFDTIADYISARDYRLVKSCICHRLSYPPKQKDDFSETDYDRLNEIFGNMDEGKEQESK
jgi:hypothetical protein